MCHINVLYKYVELMDDQMNECPREQANKEECPDEEVLELTCPLSPRPGHLSQVN